MLLESSNVSYVVDGGAGPVFSAEVSVRNFLTQALGTTDGVAVDEDGIRVFFVSGPTVTAGSGEVSVKNADGTADFTGTAQPYFQYSQILKPGERSALKTWEWDVPETVEGFSFVVGVSAAVQDEDEVTPAPHSKWKQVSVGDQHVCALDMDGRAYCWGNGASGRLGNGSVEDQLHPVAVAGDHVFESISAGVSHTCGVTTDGDGYCWGGGNYGRLGNDQRGDDYFESAPVLVLGGHKWVSIKVGRLHTCGLTTDGAALCWGSNGNSMLGHGDTGARYVPDSVAGGIKFSSVDAGYYHSCGVAVNGDGYCWGNGNNGRSGDGNSEAHNIPTPNLINGGHKYQEIEAGSAYTCGLTDGGEIYCFGLNGSGQHGNGTTSASSEPGLPVAGGHKFVSFHNTFAHTCGITDQGELYCWGSAGNGRLGNGTTSPSQLEPIKIPMPQTVIQVSTGHSQTCAITADNTLYCWGNGANGRLASGSTDDVHKPAPISPISF